ncbi:acyltransferase, partial [bacterium AH-315-F18]|nr:acyltransferase [bacterium AH-315-F18]
AGFLMRFNALRTTADSLSAVGKYPCLDGLRAIAILLVLVTHAAQHIPGLSWVWGGREWLFFLYNGWMGVDLFFVLSGFLIVDLLLREIEKTGTISFWNFYIKRFFRIVPPFYVVVFFIVVGLAPDVFYEGKPVPGVFDVLSQLAFLGNYHVVPGLAFSWSLSIEEQFYLVCPLVLLLISARLRSRSKLLIIGFLLLWALPLLFRWEAFHAHDLNDRVHLADLMRLFKNVYYPFQTRFDALLAGAAIAFLRSWGITLTGSARKWAFYLALVGIALLLSLGGLKGGWFNVIPQFSLVAIVMAGLVAASIDVKTGFLNHPALRVIGKYSYGMYLMNVPVLAFSYQVLSGIDVFATSRPGVQFLIFLPTSLVLIMLVETLLYFLVEGPSMQLRTRFLKRGSASPAKSARP